MGSSNVVVATGARRRRGALAAALALALVLAVVAPSPAGAARPGADRFPDVPAGHPFAEAVRWAAAAGIAAGYPDGTFRPGAPVTRQAFAALVQRALAGPGAPPPCTRAAAPDVPADHPFCPEIAWLLAATVEATTGHEPFEPTTPIDRGQAAWLLARAQGHDDLPACTVAPFPDVPASHPYCAEIAWVAEAGIALGRADGSFGPTTVVSRGVAAAMLHRLHLAGEPGPPVPSAGCGTSQQGAVVEQRRTLQVGGEDRWFLLTVPARHDGTAPVPLVLDFHGLQEGAQVHTMMSEYSQVAAAEGFVVAFPHGRFEPVRWDADPASDPNLDLAFVDAILDTLGQQLCLDRSRTYATGLSYGAMFTSLLTCARADRFAAVAPIAGAMAWEPCPQARSVPLLSVHGTEDTWLAYDNHAAQVATWAQRNGCRAEPTDAPMSDEVVRRTWDCPVGADVELLTVEGGGHAWPGSAFSQGIAFAVGYTTMDFHASRESWAFFERFWLPDP